MRVNGVLPALLTPYDSDGRVSEEMLRRLVAHYVQLGVSGLYVCGAAGEGVLLSVAERKKVTEIVMSESRQRVPAIVHVGSVSTEDAAELAAHAERVGANAIASVPPFFYPCSAEAIFQHYSNIAKRSRLPLLLYNIPALTGVTVTPRMMLQLMEIPTAAGMKFSSNDLFQMHQILELGQGRLNVLSGSDEIFLAALAMGAHGAIGLTINFMPKLFMDIFSSFQAGEMEKAQRAQFAACRIIAVLTQYSVIPAAKEIMAWRGFNCGQARGPLETLTEDQKRSLRKDLDQLGFFEMTLGF
jgi:N-acetylneuraminate lyase